MAKVVNKKKYKYKKMKNRYKCIISDLLNTKEELISKMKEMEIYYLDKIKFYEERNKLVIIEIKEENEKLYNNIFKKYE